MAPFAARHYLVLLFLWFPCDLTNGETGDEPRATPTTTGNMVVSAYLPDYRVAGVNLNASAPFLTDLVLFSIQPHARGFVSGCCLDESHYAKAREARAYKQQQVQQEGTLFLYFLEKANRTGSDFTFF